MIHREIGGGEGIAAVAGGGGDQHDRFARRASTRLRWRISSPSSDQRWQRLSASRLHARQGQRRVVAVSSSASTPLSRAHLADEAGDPAGLGMRGGESGQFAPPGSKRLA